MWGQIIIPNIERVRGGLIEGREAVLQCSGPAERKMHQDRAVKGPTSILDREGLSGAEGEKRADNERRNPGCSKPFTVEHGGVYTLGTERTRRS